VRTQRCIAYAFAACLVSLVTGSALADAESGNPNAFVKGTYQLSNSISCATSDLGFTQPDLQAIGSGQTQDISFPGIITYDGCTAPLNFWTDCFSSSTNPTCSEFWRL